MFAKKKDGSKATSNIVKSTKNQTTREQSITRRNTKKEEKTVPKSKSKLIKQVDEDEKLKKTNNLSSSRRVSKPTDIKKSINTPKTSSRKDKPVTPPSSRVTKTQFFPSKKMYSNVLKDENITKNKISSVKNHSSPRTVSNSKIKIRKDDVSPDSSSMSERPRTATLRKGSIVHNNVVGPEVPKSKVPPKSTKEEEEEAPNYEDDFDSYESDFEEYSSSDSTTNLNLSEISTSSTTESIELKSAPKHVNSASTDDEKKLDSGNYELPEARHKQILDNIKESIEKENSNLQQEQPRSNMGSLSDEGFEDGKSLQFINFLEAQRKYQRRKSLERKRKRGEEILSMIRLDHYSFTLFDLAPVPYDVFIKTFGKSNTIQASVQTGEDDVDEELQTEDIFYANKWTQFPPDVMKVNGNQNEEFWESYKCSYLGVGGDVTEKSKSEILNEARLEKFLLSAGNLILNIQTEESLQISENSQNNKSNIPFSKGYVLYDTSTNKLVRDRPIKDITFCMNNINKILIAHGSKTDEDCEESILCLWNIANVEEPELILVCFGEITCCTFSNDSSNLIFGGFYNGTITVWDTQESIAFHKNKENESTIMRTPTYSTEINYGHCCKIVSIKTLATSEESHLFTSHKPAEICSLDEDGEIIIWGVIFKEVSCGRFVENQGLAHWGSVIITINIRISLRDLHPEIDDFKCTDMALSYLDSSQLYISTNYGIIIHCLANGGRANIKTFLPDTQFSANCLEICPFSSNYIISGFDNGDINFYSSLIEKPLMVLSNKDTIENKSKIQIIQWSRNRPLIFYTKDIANTIHVWNLKVSDMLPTHSIPFKDNIVCMKLSPGTKNNNNDVPEKTYMMIATDKGLIYVHLLGDEHDPQPSLELEKDKNKFFNYINRYV